MRRMITELPSRVINRWQVQGGDACILPVGSVEVLGPHLPLGARCLVADAFARVLADAADALILPVLPLTPVFGTQCLAGTIDVDEPQVNRLVRSVLDDLVETGFRRIVLVTYLEYAAYYLPQELWEDRKAVCVGVDLNERLPAPLAEYGLGHDSVILGALKLLGRKALLEKCLAVYEKWRAAPPPVTPVCKPYVRLREIGHTGARFPKGYYPVLPYERLDVDEGAEILTRVALAGVPALEAMRKYNEFLVRRDSRGLLKGAWFKEEEGGNV